MSDKLRTALQGGGSIRISIDTDSTGDFRLLVTEEWERLTGVQRDTVTAGELATAPDPDGLLRARLEALAAHHLNWRAREKNAAAQLYDEG